MTKTLAQLTKALTEIEVRAAIYASLATQGVNVTLWKAGSPLRTLIGGLTIVLAALSRLQAKLAQMSFLALASGSWLTLVARYVYGVDRDLGSFATGEVTLTNTTGMVFNQDPFTVTFTNGTKTYKNSSAFTLGSMGTATVAIQATEIGSASSSGADTITGFGTPLPGVTVTNAAAVVGTDVEDDPTLRLRCAEKLGTLSPNGPRDAYAYLARSAKRANGSSIGVTRVRTIADGIGGVDAYFATATGGIAGTVGDLDTDLGIVDELLQTSCAPLCITLRSHTATAQAIAVTYELWIPASDTRDDATIEALVDVAIATFLGTKPIGGDEIVPGSGIVSKSAIEDVVGTVVAGTIKRIVTVPSADVAMSTRHHAPVGTTNTCTAIHRVAGAVI